MINDIPPEHPDHHAAPEFRHEDQVEKSGQGPTRQELQDSVTAALAQRDLAQQAAGIGLFDLDVVNDRLYWDERCRNIFGVGPAKEVTYSSDFSNGLHPDDRERILQAVNDAYDRALTGGHYDVEYRVVNAANGDVCWIRATGKVYFDQQDNPQRFIGTVMDITEAVEVRTSLLASENKLRQTNEELATSKEQLQTILDTVAEGIGITDDLGNIVYTNERAREILRMDKESILKRKNSSPEWANRRLDGSPMPHEEHPVTLAITTRRPIYNQVFLVQADGEAPLYLNMNATPIIDDQGNVTGAIGSFTDATEQFLLHAKVQSTLAQLKEQEERLRLAVLSANLGTWYMNTATNEFVPSVRLKEIFGFHADEEMSFASGLSQIVPEHRQRVLAAIEGTVANGDAYDLEYPITGYHDGQLRWVRATGRLYPAGNDGGSHFSGTISDITEEKLNEQRKNDFIGIVSHELRSPLTAMNGYVQMLQLKTRKSGDASLGEILDKAKRQVGRMQALISGFLDVARLGEGKIRLNRKSFDMAALVKIAEEESLATHSSHQIIFHPVEYTPVVADQDKIEQVLVNLINNAVKYSPKGSQIDVACVTRHGMAYVCVEDHGMGITPENQRHVFDRFFRVESEVMGTVKGFGLGLYLCKEIIEQHSGRIGVESELGKGSKFWFELPCE